MSFYLPTAAITRCIQFICKITFTQNTDFLTGDKVLLSFRAPSGYQDPSQRIIYATNIC